VAHVKDYNQMPLLTPDSTWMAPTELPNLTGVKNLAFDVETNDPQLRQLGPGVRRGAYVVGMSLGTDDGRRWYLPICHQGGGNLDERIVWRWARSELNAFCGNLVGANLVYDLDFAAEQGVTFPNVHRFHDVQIAEPLIDEWRDRYNLDSLASDYLGDNKRESLLREAAEAYGFGDSMGDIKGNLWRLPAGYVGDYGEGDADLPLRILPLQLAKLEEQGLTELFDLESRLLPVLLGMRRRGVAVSIEQTEEVRERLVRERAEIMGRLKRLAGPKAELRASESFAEALKNRGLDVPLTPKTRKPQIQKAWLQSHAGDELVDLIIGGRAVDTIINTFIDGHILSHSINGRIHCEFNQLKRESDGGGISGTIARLSSSSPNLQNLPKRDQSFGALIRSIFRPETGERWGSCDLSQIEFRLLVHYAQGQLSDETRQRYCDDPATDFHQYVGTLLGVNMQDKSKRSQVKSTNFCKIYGGGAAKIATVAGCSLDEATVFMGQHEAAFPFVKQTTDLATRRAGSRGYVTTIYGRRQRFPLFEPVNNRQKVYPPLPYEQAREKYGHRITRYQTYAALNRVLQGSAADMMKKAMVDIHESGVTEVLGSMLITVHDELNASMPDTPVGLEAMHEVQRMMQNAIGLRVPVLSELKIANNWGECA
jgi:DNA polymerase I-like protein with 3'-5' exonuclease and polymerase domains